MIELTRLNGHQLYLNSDLLKWVEAAPDTLIALVNGEKIVVRESCEEVVRRMTDLRVQTLAKAAVALPADHNRLAQMDSLARVAAASGLEPQSLAQSYSDTALRH